MVTPPRSPPQSDGNSEPQPKKTRQSTRLRRLTLRSLDHPRPIVNVDPATGRASGPEKQKFHSFLGVVAQENIPIVYSNWKNVPETLKDMVWGDILAKFDIPEAENAKKKEIRKKAKESKKYNDCPHVLSRGGYDLLEKKLLDEKTKQSQQQTLLTENPLFDLEEPPSPIKRHVKWKMARTKRYGQMTSKAAKEILDRIDSLEEQTTQGSFVPHGWDDILNTAIGKLEHPGQALAARLSTKGSNVETADVDPSGNKNVSLKPTMGLYVQRKHTTVLVALGKICEGGSAIHNVTYVDDVVREFDTSPRKLPETNERGTNDFDHDPLRQLIKSLYFMYDTPVELKWDGSKFGLSNVDASFFLTFSYVNEIVAGYKCFWMSGAQLWVMLPCMDSLSHNRYTMQRIDVLNVSITYKHGSRNRNERGHWQLVVLCPATNVVAWFCSLRKKPDTYIKTAINNVMKSANTTADGTNNPATPKWIEVKSHVQSGGYECGYYVMHWMWNIVSGGLKNDWSMLHNSSKNRPFCEPKDPDTAWLLLSHVVAPSTVLFLDILQDFPHATYVDFASLFPKIGNADIHQGSNCDFTAQLARFMASLVIDVPSQAHWITQLTKYDFGGQQDILLLQYLEFTFIELLFCQNILRLLLELTRNYFNGSIPKSLGRLSSVVTLNLLGNRLTGSIPSEIGDMASLQELILEDNQLEGPLPLSLGKMSNLLRL
ncbi:putative leucine-rich repeat receptor-like serine/threonine-protein kinase [Glycine soja]